MKTYRWIVMIILMLSVGTPAMSASAAAPYQTATPPPRSASISLSAPIPNPAVTGGDITFDLVINVANINPGVSGAEVYLSYNPALVAPPTTPNGAAEVLPDFFGSSIISINEVLPAAQCPSGGGNPCVHLVLAGPAQVTHNGVAARFHFSGLAEGMTCFNVVQSALVDANGFAVTHVPATQQCVPIQFRATITGVVQRQGVPGNPNAGGGTLACSSISASGTAASGPLNTDINGGFNLTNLSAGTYTVRAVYPGYLATEKAGVSIVAGGSTSINLGTTSLRGGDANGDNAINILDIGAIISKFGRTGVAVKSASANCTVTDEPVDLNDDGSVNISDLAIAAGNWGSVGPKAWP